MNDLPRPIGWSATCVRTGSLSPMLVATWFNVQRKLRELIADLERAGFILRSEKGSHRVLQKGAVRVVLSGKTGADAKPCQERDITRAIKGES